MLKIQTAPVTWPIGMGRDLKGIYHLLEDRIYVYEAGERGRVGDNRIIEGLDSAAGARAARRDQAAAIAAEIELVRGASDGVRARQPIAPARQTPVFFGSAIGNFGVEELLRAFVRLRAGAAAARLPRALRRGHASRSCRGFVFKIQANMDPGHRDRIAFLRLCSGRYQRGMRLQHVRLGKEMTIADALTFMAADRSQAEEAYAGDIIGLHNHGTINIGDSFSEGEALHFTGVPNFAPEIFRRAVLKDPLRMKALSQGARPAVRRGRDAAVPAAAQ